MRKDKFSIVGREGTAGGRVLHGVLALTAASLAVKLLGFFYKVPLNALLGDEMANVNAAYAIYAVLYTVSTAGIPSAVALAVSRARAAGDYARVHAILRVTLGALLLIGGITAGGMLLFSRPISVLNSGGDAYFCMLAIAPALFFSAVVSVFRGYFQGFQYMTPTAVSEIIEAGGKTVFGILFALVALRVLSFSARTAAALSVFGITLGVAAGAVYLSALYLRRGRIPPSLLKTDAADTPRARRGLLLSLAAVALPIALTGAMMNLTTLADAQLMRPLLERYFSDAGLAKAVYSDYSTGAVTLYNMPGILIYPIAAAIVPYISSAMEARDTPAARRAVEVALRAASLISLPSALGMSILAGPILSLVFQGDADMASHAGAPLSVLAFSVFFASVFTVTNAALQAMQKERLPILSVLVGLAVKLLTISPLTLALGALGAPISTLLFFITVTALNLYFITVGGGVTLRLGKTLLRPLLAALLAALSAYLVFSLTLSPLGNSLAVLLGILTAVLLYLPAVLFLGCVGREELALIPGGERVVGRLCKASDKGRTAFAQRFGNKRDKM